MIDSGTHLKQFLLTDSDIVTLVADRIWPERTVPIAGYKPTQGAAICFRTRGGGGLDYSSTLLDQSWQFKCYGLDETRANALYRNVVEKLHDAKWGAISYAELEVVGQTLYEEGTEWVYNLSFFHTIMMFSPE